MFARPSTAPFNPPSPPPRSWFSSGLVHQAQFPRDLKEVDGGVYLAKEPPVEQVAREQDPVRSCTWNADLRAGLLVGAPNAAPETAATLPGDEMGFRTLHLSVFSAVHMLIGEKDKKKALARWGEVTDHALEVITSGPVLDVVRYKGFDNVIGVVALTDVSLDKWRKAGVVVDEIQRGKKGITNPDILQQVGR